ncbi:hypothetical protein [Plasmodium yoelii yoelii]|uniref:Uncharacterized protein n=1 Tax=Plasmodium yoelii yoelii TaxID=73239 RepID=Q7RM14_PLAYO|nr:hypothetical protein [Plasmodium yoelii yoelii]
MPKNLNLFGKYLRRLGKSHKKGFKKKQIIHPIPVKAYGRVPSAASQTGLYHDEDYNYYTKEGLITIFCEPPQKNLDQILEKN